MSSVRCLVPSGDDCGEAVTWRPDDQCVYWSDVNRFLIHRYNPSRKVTRSWLFDEPCVAIMLTDAPGTLLVAIGSRILVWQPEDDTRSDFGFSLDDWPAARLNDGRAAPDGGLWIGSMANNVGRDGSAGALKGDLGRLFNLRHGQSARVHKCGIGISNTVCFSPDSRYFYFGDTPRNVIWRYDYDGSTGSLSNETVFFEGFDRGVPDGSTIDSDGYLWNCRFAGGCIVRVAPSGRVDRVIEMPVSNITTCEFGGPDRQTLFVSTARILLDHHERLAGGLFALESDVSGPPPNRVTLSEYVA
ncbi:MAG: SMP-30/gluconolactonase/LRE family protein [Pseudomonadota bacterium]